MTRTFRWFLVAILTAACTVGPDHRTPETVLRPSWLEAPQGADAAPAAGLWWEALRDPTLAQLIEAARRSSYDLRIAAARVAETQALRQGARAERFPTVDAVGSATHLRDSENTFFSGAGFDQVRNQYQAGLEASWELDLWGRVRRGVEAADADVAGAIALLQDVLRVVVAEVATEYVELRGTERELDVARRNIEALRGILALTERLAALGIGSHADVARTRGQLREVEAVVPLLQSRSAGSAHRLAVLTAGDAAAIKANLAAAASALPDDPALPTLGIPSDLLRARPDVRAAEHELAAATARIGVATAALYPQVVLNGRFGFDSTQSENLFDHDSVSFGIGPSLRWPLLDFGRVRAQIRAQDARAAAALARYEQVVAGAVSEVETALVSLQSRRASREALADALTHDREALRLVEQRYREGASAFLDVLDAQRRVLAVEAAHTQAQTFLLQDLVRLNRALGATVPEVEAPEGE